MFGCFPVDFIELNKLWEQGSGIDFCAYNGHIAITDDVKVPGFKAGGLDVKVGSLFLLLPFE